MADGTLSEMKEGANLAGPLRFIFGPGLLPALALEHPDRAASLRIEHRPNHGGVLVALAACLDRIRIEARKHFVLELIIHR